MVPEPQFLFLTCQNGAESALKGEVARKWPGFRFAYSRPGFLTFKVPADVHLGSDFDPGLVLARSCGFSLGKVTGESAAALAEGVWRLYGERAWEQVHVWARESAAHSETVGFSPLDHAAREAQNALAAKCPWPDRLGKVNRPARPGDFVLDCIVVEANEWWAGYHRADSVASRWAGGMTRLKMPPGIVSRAWLKMEEALRWAQLPVPSDARFVELGSSPGGASQALLNRGWHVIGVDPAEMAPAVLDHPNFQHIRRRASQVRRREFRKIRWLTADMNVAPSYTLAVVEDIVMHPDVNVRGMLLTFKLPQWELAEHIPEFLDRVQSWGFNRVQARQLQHNRQEICVAALKQPFSRKERGRR